MKTTLLLSILFLVLFQVRGQNNSLEVPTIENHGKVDVPAENRYLMRRLLLNQTQFEQIESINTERNQLLEMVAGMYRFDPENYNKKRLELELQYDAEFEKVLTSQQFSEYLALNGRTPEKASPTDTLNAGADETQLAVQIPENSKPAKPTFNDQIHAILEKATSIRIDSALIAKQDSVDFEPLTQEEESLLNGLRPMNATLIAIQADTATKKPETVANTNTGLKTDGECKTCYAVDPEDSTAQKSKMIALKTSKKAANKASLQNEWNIGQETNYNETNSVAETDSLFSEPKNVTSAPENSAPEKPQTIAVEQEQNEMNEEETQLANSEKNENSLVIPADEVKKLKENLTPSNKNGTVSDEKTATEEPGTPQLAEPFPLNKSLAEDLEP